MGNNVCTASELAADAAGSEEAKQLFEEETKASTEVALKLLTEVAQGEPMWRTDAREHSRRVEKEAAAVDAAVAPQAVEQAVEEEGAATVAAEAAEPPKGATKETNKNGDEAKKDEETKEAKKKDEETKDTKKKDEETKDIKKKDEEAKKKAQDPKKKRPSQGGKKPKEESKESKAAEVPTPADSEEARKKAIADREKAWKAMPKKEKDDLSKKIILAAKQGNVSELRSLLDSGASPNAEDGDGWTPLIRAADAREKGAIELLLKEGANAKAAVKLGEYGQTALHFAARHGQQEIAVMLAPFSNLKAKNHVGKTPRDVASAEGHKDLSKWLRAQEKALDKAV